jgi:lipoteichoic acid synthase
MDPATPQETTPPDLHSKKDAVGVFWIAFWMAVALIGAKLYHVPVPEKWGGGGVNRYAKEVGMVVAADLVFVAAVGLAGWGLIIVSRESWRRRVRIGFVVFATICVFYALLSARIFEYLRTPLTYPLIYLMGDMRSMRSSISVYASWWLTAIMAGVPLVFVALVIASERYLPLRPLKLVRGLQLVAVVCIVALFWLTRDSVLKARPQQRRIAESPHYVLCASCVAQLFGDQRATLSEPFSQEHLDDFRPAGERPEQQNLPTPGVARGPRNVIVVICESVGTQFLSLYGSKYKTWPRMEAEAQHALVFENYYSHVTNTANSHINLALSVYPPLDWRQYTIERPDYPGTTAAQMLKGKGYRTAFISAGYNTWANQANFLKGRGCDVVQDAAASSCPEFFSWGVEDKCMVDATLKFIDADAARKQPFFVFAWTQGTHHPYGPEYGTPSPGWDNPDFLAGEDPQKTYGKMWWDLGRYMCALYELDKQLGRLLESLRSRNLADDTIVIITGDHGDAFWHPHQTVGHSGKVHQEDVHVPLMIWSPKLFKNAPRSKQVGAHVDLSPTILDLLDVPLPATWQGRSLFSPAHPNRAYFYGAVDDYYFGMREGNLKYIYNATVGREELFDLAADPLEQRNLAETRPEDSRRMRARLAAWVWYQNKSLR